MIFEPIYPSFFGTNDSEALTRYLYQLNNRLEYAFMQIEKSSEKDRKWESLGLATGVSKPSLDYGRAGAGCFFRCDGDHVFISFNCSLNYSGTRMRICADAIPTGYRPKRCIFSTCDADGRCAARVSVDPSGYVYLDWIQDLTSSGITSSASVKWIDGYIDYWI